MGARRGFVIAGFAAAIVVAGAGVAAAGVSDGNYHPEDQRCTGHADDFSTPDRVEEGCQNSTLYLADQQGHEVFRVGTQQTAEGETVSEPLFDTGEGFDPASGLRLYIGADDNLSTGEHDSSDKIGDGPSDGGAIQANLTPETVQAWVAAVQADGLPFLLTHPVPGADAGGGACADGVCFSVQTTERVAYQGGGEGERHVADYEGKQWDPETCAGPGDGEEDCGPGGITTWHNLEGTTYVEPGVQVYEDPNPAGSPLGPYPLPGVYVGTCGVIIGGGPVVVPASPLTNAAGQLDLPTGC